MSPDRPKDGSDTLRPVGKQIAGKELTPLAGDVDQSEATIHLVLDALRDVNIVSGNADQPDTLVGGGMVGLIDQAQAARLIQLDEAAHALPLVAPKAEHSTKHEVGGISSSVDMVAQTVEKRMTLQEAERFREARAAQLQWVLAMLASHVPTSDLELAQLLANAKTHCPEYTQEELLAILNQSDLVLSNPHLQGALITGGTKVLAGPSNKPVSIFSMTLLGQGGLGKVTDAYLLKDAAFVPAVVKESLQWDLDPNDQYYQEKVRQNALFQANFLVEMNNAIDCLAHNVPGMIQPLLVVPGRGEGETSLIAYEKITNKEGKSLDFSYVAMDHRFLISKKLAVFAGAIDVLADLHADGKAHLDFKPENVMVDETGKARVIDIGSRFSLSDEIHIDPDADPKPYGTITKRFDYGMQSLGFTPSMLSLASVKRAVEQGKSLEVVDRMALGNSLVAVLRDAGFLINPDYPDLVTYQKYFNLPDDQYPPAALREMLALAAELRDIDSDTPLRPLTDIANEVRLIAIRFKLELDPMQMMMCNQTNVVLQSDL